MGLETFPFAMDAAAPKGACAAASITGFLGNRTCPAVPVRGPEAGSTHTCDFHGSGVNSLGSCPFLQSNFFLTFLGLLNLTK
jgi:hypothetical protein